MSNTKKAHPHAEFLRAIADGDSVDDWVATINHNGAIYTPTYFSDDILHGDLGFTMSRKPRTVNGIELPEPMREAPAIGSEYYRIRLSSAQIVVSCVWRDDAHDWRFLKRGLAHSRLYAAETHVSALLSFTEVSDGE